MIFSWKQNLKSVKKLGLRYKDSLQRKAWANAISSMVAWEVTIKILATCVNFDVQYGLYILS